MYTQLQSQKNNLAHAYILSGEMTSSLDVLLKFIEHDLGIRIIGNPNYFYRSFDRLGIDNVRNLSELQSKTAMGDGNKLFVVSFNTVTVEAQNAMLKMLEDPTPGTILFFIINNHHILLPTILSRVQLIISDTGQQYDKLAQEFQVSGYALREKIIEQFLGDSKKDIPPNRIGAGQFIAALMSILVEQKSEGYIKMYRDLERMRDYVTDRSSSIKYIMGYITIKFPKL